MKAGQRLDKKLGINKPVEPWNNTIIRRPSPPIYADEIRYFLREKMTSKTSLPSSTSPQNPADNNFLRGRALATAITRWLLSAASGQ